jgi:hypothetical protein
MPAFVNIEFATQLHCNLAKEMVTILAYKVAVIRVIKRLSFEMKKSE